MASQRDIRRRITSVQSTKKITKAMEMVAAARLRRAQQRIEATRPYAENMLEFIGGFVRFLEADASMSPLVREHDEVNTVTIIPVTADRGMCGAFNSNIVRHATELWRKYKAEGKNIHLVPVGRKGINTLRFQGYDLHNTYADITDRSAFLDAQALAHRVGTAGRPVTTTLCDQSYQPLEPVRCEAVLRAVLRVARRGYFIDHSYP